MIMWHPVILRTSFNKIRVLYKENVKKKISLYFYSFFENRMDEKTYFSDIVTMAFGTGL